MWWSRGQSRPRTGGSGWFEEALERAVQRSMTPPRETAQHASGPPVVFGPNDLEAAQGTQGQTAAQGLQTPTGVTGRQVAPGVQSVSQGASAPQVSVTGVSSPQPQTFDMTVSDSQGPYTVPVGASDVNSGGLAQLCGPPGLESSTVSGEQVSLQGPCDVGGTVEQQSVEQELALMSLQAHTQPSSSPVHHGHTHVQSGIAAVQSGSGTVQSGQPGNLPTLPVYVGSQFGIPPPPPGHPMQFGHVMCSGPTWPQGAYGAPGCAGPVPSLPGSGLTGPGLTGQGMTGQGLTGPSLAGLPGGGVSLPGCQPVGAVPSQSDQVVGLLQQQVGQLQQQNNMLMQMLQQMMHQQQSQNLNVSAMPPGVAPVSTPGSGPTGGGVAGSSTGSGGNPFKTVDAKLIPSMPTCDPGKWHTRPQQILGFRSFLESLVSWLSTLAPAYHNEVALVLADRPIPDATALATQERSQRLFFILKQAFAGSSKVMTIVRLFESQHGFGTSDGYGLLRQLKNEFAILTRTEGYYFRQLILNYRVSRASKLDAKEIVQALESEFYLYDRLLPTITDSTLRNELSLPDSEKFRLLLLNVDESTRAYLQLHAGDTWSEARASTIKYFERTSLLGQDFSKVPQLSLSAFSAGPASTSEPRDLSNVVCWKCNRKGHYAKDCKDGGSHPSSRQGTPRKGSEKGSPNVKGKGKLAKGSASAKGSSTAPSGSSSKGSSKGKGKSKKGGKGKGGKKGLRAAELGTEEGDGASEQEPGELDYETEYAHVFDEDDEQSVWSEQEGEIRLSMFVATPPCPDPFVEPTSCEPESLGDRERLSRCACGAVSLEELDCFALERFGTVHASESELLSMELEPSRTRLFSRRPLVSRHVVRQPFWTFVPGRCSSSNRASSDRSMPWPFRCSELTSIVGPLSGAPECRALVFGDSHAGDVNSRVELETSFLPVDTQPACVESFADASSSSEVKQYEKGELETSFLSVDVQHACAESFADVNSFSEVKPYEKSSLEAIFPEANYLDARCLDASFADVNSFSEVKPYEKSSLEAIFPEANYLDARCLDASFADVNSFSEVKPYEKSSLEAIFPEANYLDARCLDASFADVNSFSEVKPYEKSSLEVIFPEFVALICAVQGMIAFGPWSSLCPSQPGTSEGRHALGGVKGEDMRLKERKLNLPRFPFCLTRLQVFLQIMWTYVQCLAKRVATSFEPVFQMCLKSFELDLPWRVPPISHMSQHCAVQGVIAFGAWSSLCSSQPGTSEGSHAPAAVKKEDRRLNDPELNLTRFSFCQLIRLQVFLKIVWTFVRFLVKSVATSFGLVLQMCLKSFELDFPWSVLSTPHTSQHCVNPEPNTSKMTRGLSTERLGRAFESPTDSTGELCDGPCSEVLKSNSQDQSPGPSQAQPVVSPSEGSQAEASQGLRKGKSFESPIGVLEGFFFSSIETPMDLGSWWLIDSGASRSVVGEQFLDRYEVMKERLISPPLVFTTASGERMSVGREACIRLPLEFHQNESIVHKFVVVRALVAPVEHNLLSAHQMTRHGWTFAMRKDSCVLSLGSLVCYPMIWACCPWIKCREDERNPSLDRSSTSTSKSKSVRSQEAMEVDMALSLETVLKGDFEDNVNQAETSLSSGTKAESSLRKRGKS